MKHCLFSVLHLDVAFPVPTCPAGAGPTPRIRLKPPTDFLLYTPPLVILFQTKSVVLPAALSC